jgi:acyl-CoA thioesterase-1
MHRADNLNCIMETSYFRQTRAALQQVAALLCTLFLLAGVPAARAQDDFTILFLGDSLTEGLGLEENEAFPGLIEARLKAEGRTDIRIINGGVSGSTSASGLSRLQWFIRSQPDLMVLSLGANDGLRGLDVAEMKANIARTIEFAQANGVQVALTGMLIPPNYGPEYTQAFAQVFPDLAEQYHLPFMPFLLQDVAAVTELNQGDGIHPNAEGAKIVAENVYNFLLPLLPSS